MIPAFGFSTGDFIAIAKLVRDIWQCAKATPQLRREVEELTSYLSEFFQLMQTITLIYQQYENGIPQATENCINLHLGNCKRHLDNFLLRTHAITHSNEKSLIARLKFVPARRLVFETVNNNFRDDMDAIRLCLDAVNSHKQLQTLDISKDCLNANRSTLSTLEALVHMFGSMPRELGYTWEGGELKRHIRLIYPSGRDQFMPIDVCEISEDFHRFLLVQDDYPGRERISLGHYQVLDHATGRYIDLIDKDAWKNALRPGSKIEVVVAVGTMMKWKVCVKRCPRCNSNRIAADVFAGWIKCSDCNLISESMEIANWRSTTEPIDAVEWDFDLRTPVDPSDNSSALADENVANDIYSHQDEVEGDSAVVPKGQDRPQDYVASDCVPDQQSPYDREECLRRVTVVYSPIFNYVFRSMVCGCRLGGDASPFTVDMDLVLETPCRLHFFDAAKEMGIDLKHPEEGYDPERDPYFDRYGGHLAYALFIRDHPVVRRSIDTVKLLPDSRIEEASVALGAALRNENQKKALIEWEDEFAHRYFQWRSRHGKKYDEWVAEMRERRTVKKRGRRDSF